MTLLNIRDRVADNLTVSGYSFANQYDFTLHPHHHDSLMTLLACWDDLVIDKYLPTDFGSRSRRYGRFRFDKETLSLESTPHDGYFQSYHFNPISGGKKRIFEPMQPAATDNEFFRLLLMSNAYILKPSGQRFWDVHAHFIRIPCTKNQQGVPCPEGLHRDGFGYISIHLINANNIKGAHTTLFDTDGIVLSEVTLKSPLESIYADDRRILHYTSSFEPADGGFGHRDALLLSYDPV